MKNKIYVVTMYKYGDRNNHSYVLGVFTKKQKSLDIAEEERVARGLNKYIPEILEFDPNSSEHKTILPLEGI